MAISIELPAGVEALLRAEMSDVDVVAKVGFAVEAYRSGRLSLGQFAEVLGVSQYEADGMLKERGIALCQSEDELSAERDTLRRLVG
jgi:predicted HTH domain antitoxin